MSPDKNLTVPDQFITSPEPAKVTGGGETIQTDGAALAVVPLAPLAPPPLKDPAKFRRLLVWLDVALVLLVLVFGGLAASFPIRNSEFLMDMATGRLLSEGNYQFGVDPYTFTTEGVYWVNHAWLYDLGVYSIYRIPEVGQYLVSLLKALVIVGVGWLMLRGALQPGDRALVGAACAVLGLLALSPRLFLTSILVSFLLLALTIWLLKTATENGQSRRLWYLPLVCVLWVNLDSWFVLGPLTVALFFLAALAQQFAAPEGLQGETKVDARSLGVVLLVCVAACVINPHHAKAFMVPPALGLSEGAQVLRKEPQFMDMFLSPWESRYFLRTTGLSAGGLAWYPLALAGLVSFGLTFGSWRWWRVLCWLAFAGLASWNARMVPFFAIVAAPITALNFRDFALARMSADWSSVRRLSNLAIAGRVACLILCMGLIVATIPGWLQATPHQLRSVGWGVQPDRSLQSAVLQIRAWQEENQLPADGRWFNTTSEVTNYLAWYCPGQRAFLDRHLELFGRPTGADPAGGKDQSSAAADYRAVQNAFRAVVSGQEPSDPEDLPSRRLAGVLDKYEVRFVIFHAEDLQRQQAALVFFHHSPEDWSPCHMEARTSIFARRKPGDKIPLDSLAVDFKRQAFGPQAKPAPPPLRKAAQPRGWWTDFYRSRPLRSDEADTAFQHCVRFDSLAPQYAQGDELNWQATTLTSLIGYTWTGVSPLYSGVIFSTRINTAYWSFYRYPGQAAPQEPRGKAQIIDNWCWQRMSSYRQAQDAGPVDSLYVGVRAGRRAIAANPERPWNYLILAELYWRLTYRTRERTLTAGTMTQVSLIRHTQLAYLLNKTLQLNPTSAMAERAHFLLKDLYDRPELFDLRVHHYKEYLKYWKLVHPNLSEEGKAYQAALEKEIKQLERRLQILQDEYEVNAAKRDPSKRATIALEKGLGGEALKVLLQAPLDQLSAKSKGPPSKERTTLPGLSIEFSLLLAVGRLDEVNEAINPGGVPNKEIGYEALPEFLRLPAFEWFEIQLAAGLGDYERADEYLAYLAKQSQKSPAVCKTLSMLDIIGQRESANLQSELKIGTVSEMAALFVGYALLQGVHRASGSLVFLPGSERSIGLPYDILPYLPFQLQPPYHIARAAGPTFKGQVILQEINKMLQSEADLRTLRGWLALEAGNLKTAGIELTTALSYSGAPTRARPAMLRIRSRPFAAACLAMLEMGNRKAKPRDD
jgi:hypothetical protein